MTLETIKLLADGAPVDVTIALRLDGLLAQLTPTAYLAPQTNYTLVVTTDLLDLKGDPLEAQFEASFTTESLPPPVASVSAGSIHTCGLTTPGDAYCWGFNDFGQLGDGSTTGSLTPVLVSGGIRFSSISTRGGHTCRVTSVGDAYCWGENFRGQLGDGTRINRLTPVLVSGGLSFASVSAGWGNTCGVTTAGDAYCWGDNFYGQLGDGTTINRLTPVAVAGGLTLASLSTGAQTCGVTAAGDAYCWGDNRGGMLGDGTTINRLTPVPVAGGLTFASLSTGAPTCGVTTAGDAYCWRRDHHHPGTRVPPPPSRHDGLPGPFRATGDARARAWGVGTTDRVVRLEEVGVTGPPAVAELPRSHFVGVVFRQVVPHHNECAGRKLKALLVRFRAVRGIMRPRRSAIDPAPGERRRDWPRAI